MSLLRDAIYILLAIVSAPIWIVRMTRTGKIRTDWRQRFGFGLPAASSPPRRSTTNSAPRILLHAVSVGEVNAARQLVEALAELPEQPQLVIAATTDTGFARARNLFGTRHTVVRYPFDLSFSVRRFLTGTLPDVVVLMELEIWPNFVAFCRRRSIPVIVVNGRLSERSFRRYRWIAGLIRPMFRSLHAAAVQTPVYAARFHALGTPRERISITDTMKWDTAEIANDVDGADELAARLGIDRTQPIVVAGSTAPGEHEILHRAVPDDVQLLCAPRKPEWFDQAAAAMGECVRWSQCSSSGSAHHCESPSCRRFLLDTIGELRRAYALADVVIVGRTFVPLGGSDMIEPVALGKATIVGPHAENFQFACDALVAQDGVMQVTCDQLASAIAKLLRDPARRKELASNGRAVIVHHQGATARHVALIRSALVGHNRGTASEE